MRLLLTVAHPDDESFGCGSVLAHAAANGVEAMVVCATRGELGEVVGAVERPTPAEVGRRRELELRTAAAVLGVAEVAVLDWNDSGVDGEPAGGALAAADPAEVAACLVPIVEGWRPDVVVSLDGSDGHRDHAIVRDATLAAVARTAWRPRRTYLFCLPRSLMTAFSGNGALGTPDEAITTKVDVAALLGRRWAAMRAHASQVPPYEAMDEGLQRRFLTVDHLMRVDPPWPGGPFERDWIPR
jgi:N-acetyl-1-D-myo-inositol-2-amino-2-deoxy-alpha-D-glucopyranoside deacetylase